MKATESIRPATSQDVARLAGVSRATVSRILNGDEAPFPEVTRGRVRDAAAKLNYRPSGAARSLVRGQSDTIVVLTPDTRFGSHLQDSVDEVAAQTRPYGGNVVVRVASGSPQSTMDALLGLRPFVVLNFGVLRTAEAAELTRRGIIVVPEDADGGDTAPDAGIARLQAETLRRNGDRPLWYAATSDERPEPFSQARFAAFQEYCSQERLSPPGFVAVDLSLEGGRRALRRVFEHEDLAMIACYNDAVALTLLAGARELGIPVPEALTVIGMDDTLAGQLWQPRLTTVHVTMRTLVESFVAELRARLEGAEHYSAKPLPHIFSLVDGETA